MVLPLDMPDDYIWQPGSGKSQLSDVGELAVRMGSIVSYDRRGSVYWMDNFENGLAGWQVDGAGSDFSARYQTKYVRSGLIAAKTVGASDGSRQGFITNRINPALLTTYGLEVTFSIDVNPEFFFCYFTYYTGTYAYQAIALLQENINRLFVIDGDGAYQRVMDVDVSGEAPNLFHTIKITCDLLSLQYGRFLFDQQEADISQHAMQAYADTTVPSIILRIGVQSVATYNALAYIDNVIVTVGDP